ncbi:hypothetical protein ACHAXR_011797 [Thalassiosira sp. AJA248-18]
MNTHTDGVGPQGSIDQPEVRPNAYREANRLHSAFFGRPLPSTAAANAANDNASSSSSKKPKSLSPQNERLCMGGHRETIFGLSFSPDGKYMASASQDSTIRIWDVASHRLVATLTEGLDVKFECLRVAWMNIRDFDHYSSTTNNNSDGGETYLLASAGADGIVRLWSGNTNGAQDGAAPGKLNWHCVGTQDHFLLEENGVNDDNGVRGGSTSEEEDRPQIYAMQFVRSKAVPNMNLLLTSANDSIYMWNIVEEDGSSSPQSPNNNAIKRRKFLPHLAVQFSHLDDGRGVNQFGGDRNPDNELYVFDASHSESNDLVGAALSDGTCRILSHHVNSSIGPTCQEECVLSLPPGYFPGTRGGHLTALSWDKSGTRLATCIASGRVVLWSLQVVLNREGVQVLQPSCISVLEGGHDIGRPLFGAKYCGGENEELLMTWGVDGRVCVWDSFSVGEVLSPLCTLISHSNYPIYALDITDNERNSNGEANDVQKNHIAVGGGADGGFLGVPAYLYDV